MAATAETSTRRSLRQQPRIKNGDVVYALFDAPAADGGPYWASALVLSTCGDKGSPSGMVVSFDDSGGRHYLEVDAKNPIFTAAEVLDMGVTFGAEEATAAVHDLPPDGSSLIFLPYGAADAGLALPPAAASAAALRATVMRATDDGDGSTVHFSVEVPGSDSFEFSLGLELGTTCLPSFLLQPVPAAVGYSSDEEAADNCCELCEETVDNDDDDDDDDDHDDDDEDEDDAEADEAEADEAEADEADDDGLSHQPKKKRRRLQQSGYKCAGKDCKGGRGGKVATMSKRGDLCASCGGKSGRPTCANDTACTGGRGGNAAIVSKRGALCASCGST